MEFLVCLNSIEDALCLVQKLEQYECNADARVEDNVIDAKSLMGLVALGIGKPLQVMIHNKVDENIRMEIMQCFVDGREQLCL
mgnify:CR=1 FL=1